jgi:hypothetical protein
LYHLPETKQYDPKAKSGGFFTKYINTFFKMAGLNGSPPNRIRSAKLTTIGKIRAFILIKTR